MAHQCPVDTHWSADPLLSRFDHRVGLVTFRQTFVHRCHGPCGLGPRGRSMSNLLLLVRYRSGAEGRWIEGYEASALACFVGRRCADCSVDRRRNVASVGQPTMSFVATSLRLLKLKEMEGRHAGC